MYGLRILRLFINALVIALAFSAPLQTQTYTSEALSPLAQASLERQRDSVEHLVRSELGQQLRGETRHDLKLLQALLDRGLIESDDTETLQALGVVLGDRLKADHGLLWVSYTDNLGRSRALEVPGTREFLFPITMISRRVEAGLDVDVTALYEKAEGLIEQIRGREVLR